MCLESTDMFASTSLRGVIKPSIEYAHTKKYFIMPNSRLPLSERDFQRIVQGCINRDRNVQQSLYRHYYSIGISYFMKETSCMKTSIKMYNASFLKILTKPKSITSRKELESKLGQLWANAVNTIQQKEEKKNRKFRRFWLPNRLTDLT